MKKQGIVVERKGRKVVVFTDTGEFALIKASSILPIKGDFYEGDVIKDNTIIKRVAVLAASFLMFFILGMVDYYNPVKAVELNVKSKVIIKANRWNKVIGVTTYDKELKELIIKANIENMSLNNAIKEISSEARKENIIQSYSDIRVQAVQGNVDMASVASQIDDLNNDEKNSLKNDKNNNVNSNKPDNGNQQQKNSNDGKNNTNNVNDKDNAPIKKGDDSIKQNNNPGSSIDSTHKGNNDKSNDKVKGGIITEPAEDGSGTINSKPNQNNSNLNYEDSSKQKKESDNNLSKQKENYNKR